MFRRFQPASAEGPHRTEDNGTRSIPVRLTSLVMLLGTIGMIEGWVSTAYPQSLSKVDTAAAAQKFRSAQQPVLPFADGTLVCEAEEFQVEKPGWMAQN